LTRVFRFAPSPNGFLHIGHAASALLNDRLARECGGRFLLRIEDIDTRRARPAYEKAIYEDLAWLGLDWERPVRRQSAHFDDYADALEQLDAMGLVYACDCRRSDIAQLTRMRADWAHDPDGSPFYPGTCRLKPHQPARESLAQGGLALRLDMQSALALAGQGLSWREGDDDIVADPGRWGDVVLARKDTPASYHTAVVVDDALQGVTDVVRGRDLFHATSLHRLLQTLLDLPAPVYRHHALLRDASGEKLAKSKGAESLRDLRRSGMDAAVIRARLGF
jgi:glutamyl-Q tRNA(Asp) synthetase